MIVHKLLTGDGAEMYLPYAVSRIAYLRKALKGVIQQTYLIGDVTIRVLVNNYSDRHFIRVDVKVGAYDFYTADAQGSEDQYETYPPVFAKGWVTGVKSSGSVVKRATSVGERKKSGVYSDAIGSSWMYDVPFGNTINRQANPQHVWYPANDEGKYMRKKAVVSTLGIAQHCAKFEVALPFPNTLGSAFEAYSGDIGEDINVIVGAKRETVALLAKTERPAWIRRACIQTVKHDEYGARDFLIATDAVGRVRVTPMSELLSWNNNNGPYPASKFKNVEFSDYAPEGVVVPSPETASATTASNFNIEEDAMVPYPGAPNLKHYQTAYVNVKAPTEVEWGATLSGLGAEYPKLAGYAGWEEYDKNTPIFHFSSDGKRAVAIVNYEICEPKTISQSLDYTESEAHWQYGYRHRYFQSVWAPVWKISTPFFTATAQPIWRDGEDVRYLGGDQFVSDLILTDGIYQKHKPLFDDTHKVKAMKMTSRSLLEVDILITIDGENADDFSVTVSQRTFDNTKHYVSADYAYGNELSKEKDVERDDLISLHTEMHWSVAREGTFPNYAWAHTYQPMILTHGKVQARMVMKNRRSNVELLNIRIGEMAPKAVTQTLLSQMTLGADAFRYEIDNVFEDTHVPAYGTEVAAGARTNGTSLLNQRLVPNVFVTDGAPGSSAEDMLHCHIRSVDLRALGFTMLVVENSMHPDYSQTAGEVVVMYGDVVSDKKNLFAKVCKVDSPARPIGFFDKDPALGQFLASLPIYQGEYLDPGVPPADTEIYANYWPLLTLKQFDSAGNGHVGCLQTHPDGHFAVYSAVTTSERFYKDWLNYVFIGKAVDKNLVTKDDMVDMIWFRLRDGKWKKTSHLEALNKAWKMELTAANTFTMPATIEEVDQYRLVGWSMFRTFAPMGEWDVSWEEAE